MLEKLDYFAGGCLQILVMAVFVLPLILLGTGKIYWNPVKWSEIFSGTGD